VLGTEIVERGRQAVEVCGTRVRDDVHVCRRADGAVRGDGDAADDHICDTRGVQRREELFRLEGLGHRARVWRERTGARRG
jgi:hypothetical protein